MDNESSKLFFFCYYIITFVKIGLPDTVRSEIAHIAVDITSNGNGENKSRADPKRPIQVRIRSDSIEQETLIERRNH